MQTEKYRSDIELQIEMLKYLRDISNTMHEERLTSSSSFDFIDNAELMQLLHISDATTKKWRRQKVLLFYRLGGKIYYRISEIERLLKKSLKKKK